jgi:hypothetical protein
MRHDARTRIRRETNPRRASQARNHPLSQALRCPRDLQHTQSDDANKEARTTNLPDHRSIDPLAVSHARPRLLTIESLCHGARSQPSSSSRSHDWGAPAEAGCAPAARCWCRGPSQQ